MSMGVLTSPSTLIFHALGYAAELGHLAVVSHEQLVGGRHGIVEQLGLRLGDQRLVAQRRELGLAVHVEKLGALCGRRTLRQRAAEWRQRRTDCRHPDSLQHITP